MIYELSKYIKQPALQHHVGENKKENILNSRMIEPPFTWWFDSVIVLTFTNRRYTVIHEQIKNTYSDLLEIKNLLFYPLIALQMIYFFFNISQALHWCYSKLVFTALCNINALFFSFKNYRWKNNKDVISIWKLKR